MVLKNRTAVTAPTPGPEPVRRLYHYHELETWQQDNHYIKSGYVRGTNSYKLCLESLTYLHNETVNIYSHMVPAIIGPLAVMYFVAVRLYVYDNYLGFWEKLNFLQFGAAAAFCMGCLALFHCLKCHSHKVSKVGNQCDYLGIIVLITCSLISIMLFAFYDEPRWKYGFIALFVSLGGLCAKVTFDQKFSTPTYRPLRSLMFVLFGLSGALPVLAAVWLYGGSTAFERANAGWLVFEGIFYITGAVLYAARFPERLVYKEDEDHVAGLFDLVGASHQIFHILVVVAAYCHWRALEGCYHYLHRFVL